MLTGPRLRQVAVVARDCGRVAGQLRQAFGWPRPFHDPGVAEFGLANAVFAVGDTFVEVVAPTRPGTAAGRYLQRRGGDGGYMAIFQIPDLVAARRRLAGLRVRVVWTADLPDMAGTHLHPRDVPGAIVSLDWAAPAESWRWAGPLWTGQAPGHAPGGVTGLTIEVRDPSAAAQRWAAVLGISAASGGSTAVLELPDSGQQLRFVTARAEHGEGITAVTIAGLPAADRWRSAESASPARKDDMTALDTGTEDLRAEIDDGVAVITMNRPDRRNAFSEAMLSALGAVLAQVETDEAVGSVVLTGAGGAFCAGGDVKGMAAPQAGRSGDGAGRPLDAVIHRQRLSQRATSGRLWSMPKPTIAAIGGPAAGAGLSLALACVMRSRARC